MDQDVNQVYASVVMVCNSDLVVVGIFSFDTVHTL